MTLLEQRPSTATAHSTSSRLMLLRQTLRTISAKAWSKLSALIMAPWAGEQPTEFGALARFRPWPEVLTIADGRVWRAGFWEWRASALAIQ